MPSIRSSRRLPIRLTQVRRPPGSLPASNSSLSFTPRADWKLLSFFPDTHWRTSPSSRNLLHDQPGAQVVSKRALGQSLPMPPPPKAACSPVQRRSGRTVHAAPGAETGPHSCSRSCRRSPLSSACWPAGAGLVTVEPRQHHCRKCRHRPVRQLRHAHCRRLEAAGSAANRRPDVCASGRHHDLGQYRALLFARHPARCPRRLYASPPVSWPAMARPCLAVPGTCYLLDHWAQPETPMSFRPFLLITPAGNARRLRQDSFHADVHARAG